MPKASAMITMASPNSPMVATGMLMPPDRGRGPNCPALPEGFLGAVVVGGRAPGGGPFTVGTSAGELGGDAATPVAAAAPTAAPAATAPVGVEAGRGCCVCGTPS